MEMKEVFETYESNVRSYCRSFPEVFAKAKGSIITDVNGKEYIDFFCGAGAVNYGHNNDYIKGKIIEYLENDGFLHALDMMTDAKAGFIDTFQNKVLKPRGLDYKIMFPAPTGTNAIEAALKLARKVTKRTNVWCLMGCFHGMTLGALSLTTDRTDRQGAGLPLTNVTHIPAPYMFEELDTLKYMETLMEDDHSGVDKPAAFIIETVQAECQNQSAATVFLLPLHSLSLSLIYGFRASITEPSAEISLQWLPQRQVLNLCLKTTLKQRQSARRQLYVTSLKKMLPVTVLKSAVSAVYLELMWEQAKRRQPF